MLEPRTGSGFRLRSCIVGSRVRDCFRVLADSHSATGQTHAREPLVFETKKREKCAVWIDNDDLDRLREYRQTVGVPVSESVSAQSRHISRSR